MFVIYGIIADSMRLRRKSSLLIQPIPKAYGETASIRVPKGKRGYLTTRRGKYSKSLQVYREHFITTFVFVRNSTKDKQSTQWHSRGSQMTKGLISHTERPLCLGIV